MPPATLALDALLTALLAGAVHGQQSTGSITEHPVPVQDCDGMTYQLFTPELQPGRTYPLVFALPGYNQDPANYIKRARMVSTETVPAFVVAPDYQHRRGGGGEVRRDPLRSFDGLLAHLLEQHPIDRTRLVLHGFSMGTGFAAQWLDRIAARGDPIPFRAVWFNGGARQPQHPMPHLEFDLCVGSEETAVRGNLDILAGVRATYLEMATAGFAATYIEVPGMKHEVDNRCTEFMRQRLARWPAGSPLPAEIAGVVQLDLPAVHRHVVAGEFGAALDELQATIGGDQVSLKGTARQALKAVRGQLAQMARPPQLAPTLTCYDTLARTVGSLGDHDRERRPLARAMDRLAEHPELAPELKAREMFGDARALEDPDARREATVALAEGEFRDTWSGRTARAHLQAMGLPYAAPFVAQMPFAYPR